MKKYFNLRREYDSPILNFRDLKTNPLEQFESWFNEAIIKESFEPNAMAFATATKDGSPMVRFLLLKAFDHEGFIFFTNYESRKSEHIKENPYGSLAFYWPSLQQQVRADGHIVLLSDDESDKYFHERPHISKLSAWASPQSKPIPSREYLDNLKKEYKKKYNNFRIPRPEFWGGFKLLPKVMEFWQGRPDRLHDRFEYRLTDDFWDKKRLAP